MSKIIIASGPVIVESNKVLLDKEGDDDLWKFCGGKIRENESLQDAAKRRAQEELGIDVQIIDENPFLMYVTKELPEEKQDIILVHYLATKTGDIVPGVDVKNFDWFDINELPADAAPNIRPALEHFGFI